MTLDRAQRALATEVVGETDELVDDAAARGDREPAMHRVRRLEEQGASPVATESQKGVEQHLIAAVAQDDLVRGDTVSLGESAPELGCRRGVTIQEELVQLLRRQPCARWIWHRPLIRVQAHVGARLAEIDKGIAREGAFSSSRA